MTRRSLLALLAIPLLSSAHTSAVVKRTCPLDGRSFESREDMSGTQYGMQLDLQPVGPIAAPWSIPSCPRDGFILYKETFTPAEVEDLRKFVATSDYVRWFKEDTTYFRYARLLEHEGAGPLTLARTMLRATWQVAHDDRYPRYAQETLRLYEAWLATSPPHDGDWATAQLLCVELERRLGHFDAAAARSETLKDDPDIAAVRFVLEQEVALIRVRNHEPAMLQHPPEAAPPPEAPPVEAVPPAEPKPAAPP